MSRAWLALLALLCALPTAAQERILDYASDLRIQPDGSLDVTETIRVRAEGQRIRRGIYRDFPTRYKDRLGNRVVVDFELLGVERDGRPEPHFTESMPNGVRINTGNDDFLPVPAEFTFTLRYRTTRQLGYFDGYDELYWNVNGLGWDFPIESVSARVVLPAAVPEGQLRRAAYTGPRGAQGDDYMSEVVGPAAVVFRSTRPFGSHEGLTIALGFPKGLVPEPTRTQRLGWFFRDNSGVLVALTGLLLLVAFYYRTWNRHGRDPQAGPVFPRYEPPADFSAGEVRMLGRMGYDNRAFAADVVQMAVRGALDIHAEGKEWRLVRRAGADPQSLTPGQQAAAGKLFQGSNEVVLKNTEAARVGGARTAHAVALTRRLQPAYFVTNTGTVVLGVLLSIACLVVAFIIAAGSGTAALLVVAAAMLAAHIVFARLLKAPTLEGRERMDEVEGLRLYLSVAERDEIGAMAAPSAPAGAEPPLDAGRYEQLLPYAMALDVEAEWSGRFTRAVGVQAAEASRPGWYHGGAGPASLGLASMGSSLGSALTQHISSSATPPGSSSGSGGGGSSGGGGGGGGGGGR